jgi:hypothetical protein
MIIIVVIINHFLCCFLSNVAIQAPLIAAGVIDAVIAMLQANLGDSRVQANGIGCLANLANRADDDSTRVRLCLMWLLSVSLF